MRLQLRERESIISYSSSVFHTNDHIKTAFKCRRCREKRSDDCI